MFCVSISTLDQRNKSVDKNMLSLWLLAGVILGLADAQITSEGMTFTMAFPPVVDEAMTGNTTIILSAKQLANVVISTINGTFAQVIVPAGQSRSVAIPPTMRADVEVEEKAIHIESDVDITVQAVDQDETGNVAGYTLYANEKRPGLEMYLITAIPDVCANVYPIITVAANEFGTELTFRRPAHEGGAIYRTVNLGPYGVFTLVGLPHVVSGGNFGGWSVTTNTNKPVTVISGSPCVLMCVGPITCHGGMVYDTVMYTADLGTEYVAFPIFDHKLNETNAYQVWVTSNAENNLVEVPGAWPGPGQAGLLKDGNSFYYNVDDAHYPQYISCSKVCMAYIYSIEQVSFTYSNGPFLTLINANHLFSDYIVFGTPPDDSMTMYLSIVANGTSINSLYLNGVDLSVKTQTPVNGTNMVALHVMLDPGSSYQLYTYGYNRFAAYVYGFAEQRGFGYMAGFNVQSSVAPPPPTTSTVAPTTTPPAITTTTPAPNPAVTPLVRIEQSSLFSSPDESVYSASCTASYSSNFNSKVQSMIFEVNQRMDTLCPGRPSDVRIVSTASALTTDGADGALQGDFFLRTDAYTSFNWTWTCANNIAVYLEDMFNWGYPILPTVSGCPPVTFASTFFNDSVHWFCDNTQSRLADDPTTRIDSDVKQAPPPHMPVPDYTQNLESQFHTHDSSSLSLDCNVKYNNQWQAKATTMLEEVREEMALGNLCSSTPGVVARSIATEFGSSSDLGIAGFIIHMHGHPDDTYDQVYTCTNEVVAFMTPFSNWGEPLLNGEPGCPFLIFDDPSFYFKNEEWFCAL